MSSDVDIGENTYVWILHHSYLWWDIIPQFEEFKEYIVREKERTCKGILCLTGINFAFLALFTSSGSLEWMIGITGLAFMILFCLCFQIREQKLKHHKNLESALTTEST